jgi:hypothetical protein
VGPIPRTIFDIDPEYERLLESFTDNLRRDVRPDFNSLQAMFHVADTHFELFRKNVENVSSLVEAATNGQVDLLNKDVNMGILIAYSR